MQKNFAIPILLTGASGQLGQSFRLMANDFPDFKLIAMGKSELDITNEQQVSDVLFHYKPKAVINCAAYTNVEMAEKEAEIATAINAAAVAYLGKKCGDMDIPLIHFSTDYVFDGMKKSPYVEADVCRPLSVYGKSKYEGEQLLEKNNFPHYTFRVSWLYSKFGNNFFKTILKRAYEMGQLKVVNDQIASPTYAGFLAKDIFHFLQLIIIEQKKIPYGIYHYEQTGEASWYDFTCKIMEYSGIEISIEPVSTSMFPMIASRPAYSKLDGSLLFTESHIPRVSWERALQICIQNDNQ